MAILRFGSVRFRALLHSARQPLCNRRETKNASFPWRINTLFTERENGRLRAEDELEHRGEAEVFSTSYEAQTTVFSQVNTTIFFNSGAKPTSFHPQTGHGNRLVSILVCGWKLVGFAPLLKKIHYVLLFNITGAALLVSNGNNALCAEVSPRTVMTSADERVNSAVKSQSRCMSMLIGENDGKSNSPPGLVQVDSDDMRDFIFPMTERYLYNEAEIPALMDLLDSREDLCKDLTTEILDLLPKKGCILPNSSQYVYFELDALQHMDIDARVACYVESGPTEIISLKASTDVISYLIDKNFIYFDHQLFGELCRKTLTIVNRGAVGFSFGTKIVSEDIERRTNQQERIADVDHLRVEPRCGTVDPMAKMCLDITYCTGRPGPFYGQFDLEIAHHAPLSIHVAGFGTLPQVYLAAPRSEAFKQLPLEMCYQAVSALSTDFLIEARRLAVNSNRNIPTVDDDALQYSRIPENEKEHLAVNGWMVLPDRDILPTETDIEMAVERLLTTEHIRENMYIPAKHDSAVKQNVIPSLFVPEYVIDMGYVVVGRMAYYSVMLINYGPTSVDVRIRYPRSKNDKVKNSGISVKFHDRNSLPVGESTPLNVVFHPSRSMYTERRTDLEHIIYLEVTHGATIPISVRAVATYPFLTTHTTHLLFDDVAIGNCMLMPILLRNNGWVPCEWEATIRCEDSCSRSKEDNGPFFIHYSADTFLPGYESIMNIYFKPSEAKESTAQLRIKVDQSICPVLVSMSGRGIEPELYMFEDTLRFETALPYVQTEPKTFFLKNMGPHPVEVFWRNFDITFMEEERIVRILMHYYGVDEILFPPRRPGEKLPPRVYDFCKTLTEEMMASLTVRKAASEVYDSKQPMEFQDMNSRENEERGKELLKNHQGGRIYNASGHSPYQSFETIESSSSEYWNETIGQGIEDTLFPCHQNIEQKSGFSVQDPTRTEALLHCYIDELRGKGDFAETMKDPVKGVFEDAASNILPPADHSSPQPRTCVIFHGAPFTGYQQAACQVGKGIGVPVLNINSVITEIIALGNSVCSNELRKIVNKNYNDLQSRSKMYRNVGPCTNSVRSDENSDEPSRRTLKVGDENVTDKYVSATGLDTLAAYNEENTERRHNSMTILSKLPAELDDLEEFSKIPQLDEFESMGSLDEYECKIQSILLLQQIISLDTGVKDGVRKPRGDPVNDKASGRPSSRGTKEMNAESTFLGISPDLLHEALKQRLSMPDFNAGFTVETLENIFVKIERDTLVMLLSIIGNIRHLLFVTFHNTLNTYLNQNEKVVAANETKATTDLENKLIAIKQMTWAEYEGISEDDKILYASNTYDSKRADGQRRRSDYNRRLAKALSNRKTPPLTKRASAAALMYGPKTYKSRMTKSEPMKSLASSSNGSEETKAEGSTGMNSRKTREAIRNGDATMKKYQLPTDAAELSRLVDMYQKSLANLQPLLANWDPFESTYIETPKKNKTPKSSRVSDTVQRTDEESKGIDVWYVSSMDPWNSDIYDRVVSYLVENTDVRTNQPVQDQSKISLDSKLYSVINARPPSRSSSPLVTPRDVYTLTSILEVPEAGFNSPTRGLEDNLRSAKDAVGQLESDDLSSSLRVIEEVAKSRWIIRPNEVHKFNVRFTPNTIGFHKDEYHLSIVGSSVTRSIQFNGYADIPRLNMAPEVIFSKVEQSKLSDCHKPAYFLDVRTYDFGPIPLTKLEAIRGYHRREAKFVFSNLSTIHVTAAFYLMENSDVYNIAPDLMEIGPGESNILDVSAKVSEPGPNPECLLLCIRNNPRVEIIQLQSCGTELEMEVDGNVVSFGRMLLWRKAKRIITVRNKSNIPLHWRLNFGEEGGMDGQVTMHPEHGHVLPLATCDIECSFFAKLVGVMERKSITIQAYVQEYDAEPAFTNFITISGECYDVNVNLNNANPIRLQSIAVGTLTTETFSIENHGPYEVGFIVKSETLAGLDQLKINFPSTLIEDLNVEPASGCLSSGEAIIVSVNFLPRDELSMVEAPLFRCQLIDSHQTPTVVADFPIPVSLSAHYAKFKIEPSNGLNFGPIAISERKTMVLKLENIGHFPFQYNIKGPAVPDPPLYDASLYDKIDQMDTTDKADKIELSASHSIGSMAQSKIGDEISYAANVAGDQKFSILRMGPFILSRDHGVVEAGAVENIAVDCCPNLGTMFEERIFVFVPNMKKNGKNGFPVKLSANGCIPAIDLHDLDTIFQENFIVDSFDDFVCPRELGSHSVYSRKERCLYFRRMVLSSTHATRFRLHNPGLVFSDVALKIARESLDSGEGDGGACAFVVEPQKARISAMSTEIFTILFSPTLLGSHTAVLDIVLELPPPLESPWISVKLSGEGVVPKVVLLEPTTLYKDDQILMNFGRSLVEAVGYRVLRFKNVGTVEAKVIVEINEDAGGLFTLDTIDQDVKGSSAACRLNRVVDKHRITRCLIPEDIASLTVKFVPLEVGRYQGRIDIYTVNNPYEKIVLVILGESFTENVILEGLWLTENTHAKSCTGIQSSKSRKGSRDSQLKTPLAQTAAGLAELITPITTTYKLDYGSCSLNESKVISFKITNKSRENSFRFEWASHPNVVFSPSIGHLGVLGSKTIVATFCTLVPIVHTEVPLECKINAITLLNLETEESGWDDRQQNARWGESESGYSLALGRGVGPREHIFTKAIEPMLEPAAQSVVPASTQVIQVILCAAAAYSQYNCAVKEINFKDVLMFQCCKYNFILSNPGIVDMSYKWELHMGARGPMRTSNSTMCAIFKSLDNACGSCSHPKSRTSGGTMYLTEPLDHNTLRFPIIASAVADNSKNTEVRLGNAEKPLYPSSSTAVSNTSSTDSCLDEDYVPFEIKPEDGVLPPGKSTECTLLFSPLDACDYQAHLKCRVQNLDPALPSLSVTVTARSLLPYCHFNIPESDYLSGGKRDAAELGLLRNEIDGSLADRIKVVEFQVVGVGQMHVEKFCLTNPTEEDYHFSWQNCSIPCIKEISYFDCVVAEGVAQRGKQTELTFTFLAKDVGTFESCWIFSIDRYKLDTTFLFVATVTNPSVYFIPGHLKMKPLIIGAIAHASITIFNSEIIPLSFHIMPKSLDSDGRVQRLIFDPMSGILQPRSEHHFKIRFEAVFPGESEFVIHCCVEKLDRPLVATVTTKVYSIEPSVVYRKDDRELQQIDCDTNNIIDCGTLQVEKPFSLKIHITNVGASVFNYTWDLHGVDRHRKVDEGEDKSCWDEWLVPGVFTVSLQGQKGSVTSQSAVICTWTITAHQHASVLNQRVTLKIRGGTKYEISLKGVVNDPSYLLNSNRYDFGPSHIQSDIVCPNSTKVDFVNNEATACTWQGPQGDL